MKLTLPALLVVVIGLLLGQAAHTVFQGPHDDAKLVAWGAEVRWIGPAEPSYQAYFRHTFFVDSLPDSAWLRLAADNSFELYVNGFLVSREETPSNHTKGLGDGLNSQIDQPINQSRVYRAPIESSLALWNSPDWKHCVYEDIGKYLVAGRNVIAVAVGSTVPHPRLAIEGSVRVTPKREIRLATGGGEWFVSSRPENRGYDTWYDPRFPDNNWSPATQLDPVRESTYSRLSRAALELPPYGRWISGPESSLGEIWLRGQWNLPEVLPRAFVRVSANVSASVMINGRLIDNQERALEGKDRLLIYEVSRLLRPGTNYVAVRLMRPLAEEQPNLAGAAPQFYLDGWVESEAGAIASPFATDQRWIALKEPSAHWYQGAGRGEPALVLGTQRLNQLSRANRGDAAQFDYLAAALPFGLALFAGICCAAGLMYGLSRWWFASQPSHQLRWNAAAALVLPVAAVLAAIALLTHRYGENDIALFLTDYRASLIMLVAFCATLYLSLFNNWLGGARAGQTWGNFRQIVLLGSLVAAVVGLAWNEREVLIGALIALASGSVLILVSSATIVSRAGELVRRASAHPLVTATLLAAIVAGGFALRTRGLPASDLSPDENTSLDVIRGVLRSGGAPETTSGIWYTRSPAYHYAAAVWLQLFGDTLGAAHVFSLLWATGLLVVAFFTAKQLTRRNDLSLLITAFMAVDQWLIVMSQGIRFYVVVEFLTLLCFYLFFKGFVERGRPAYRYTFFIALTLAILNQEMMITLVPIFGLGFLMFYKPFRLREDWPLIIAAATTLVVFFFNVFVFYVKCITPTIALGSTTDSVVKPHLENVTGFISGFFMGSSRVHVVFAFFFFIGFVHSLARQDWRRIFLFASVLLYLAELTVLVRARSSLRYTCPVYPLFMILAITSAFDFARSLAARYDKWITSPVPLRLALPTIMLVTLLLGQEYPRLLLRANEHLVKGTNEVTRYIREHRAETDIVVSTSAPAAAVELGGLDYYLAGNVLNFDVPYRDGNFVRDRWGGGVLVSNPEAFCRVFETSDRVWLYYDEVNESKLSPEMRYYVRTTGRPVMESYATTLRLWDRQRDPLPLVPRQGRDIGPY